ncbi:MAG: hypothetical protein AAF909_10710 [Pseudomonadota bacterium]
MRERNRRPPAPRLRLGHWLPSILTGGITLLIPALLITAERIEARRLAQEAAIAAEAADLGPDCARDLSDDLCLCKDFDTQAQAVAYVSALEALGRAPRGRFGLFTDDSDTPCAHLPER